MKDFFYDALKANEEKIVKKWVDFALSTYPSKAKHFFENQKDPFLNPVGNILRNELTAIYKEILKPKASDDFPIHVDSIVRVRAVQDFSPSAAVVVFRKLKEIVEEELDIKSFLTKDPNSVLEFYRKVDDICFLAFDIFMKCRERIWELKTKEFQASLKNILRHYQKTSIDSGN